MRRSAARHTRARSPRGTARLVRGERRVRARVRIRVRARARIRVRAGVSDLLDGLEHVVALLLRRLEVRRQPLRHLARLVGC